MIPYNNCVSYPFLKRNKSIKHIILKNDRYAKVKSGEMTCWLTLNDDWAKALQVGETVCIVNDNPPNNEQQACYARIKGYYVYGTFTELYNKVNKNELGYDGNDKENIALIKSQMYLQCTPESEKKYGVRGIKFEYLPNYKTMDEMDEQEIEQYLNNLVKQFDKQINKQFKAMDENGGRIKFLTAYISKYPPLFASMDFASRDMLKYFISQDIKAMQGLIETIEKCEKEHQHIMFPSDD